MYCLVFGNVDFDMLKYSMNTLTFVYCICVIDVNVPIVSFYTFLSIIITIFVKVSTG